MQRTATLLDQGGDFALALPVALVLAASGLGVIGLQLAVQAFGEFALVARQPVAQVGVCASST